MTRLLKYLSLITVGVVMLAVSVAALLFTLIDPERFRPALEDAFAARTGMALRIDGEINWSFRPVFGLSIEDTRLNNRVAPQELASVSRISLKLAPMALLRGRLDMEELIARDLHIRWFVDGDGQANWLAGTQGSRNTPPAQRRQVTDIPASFDIRRIDIRDASVSVRDLRRGTSIGLENLSVTSRDANLAGQPFPLEIHTLLVNDNGKRELPINLQGNARLDRAAGDLGLEELRLSVSPMELSGELSISGLNDDPQWQGVLTSNTFNLNYLLEHFMAVDAGPGIDTETMQFNAQMRFEGDSRGATLSSLQMNLDDMQADLSADLLFPDNTRPLTLAYRLDAGTLDIARMLPATPRERPAADDPEAVEQSNRAMRLPLETLNSMNVRGNHRIGSLRIAGLSFDDIDAELVLENGVLELETSPIAFHGGELAPSLRLDASVTPARLDTRLLVDGIRSAELGETLLFLRPFTGRLDLDGEHSMRGDTTEALFGSLTGLTRLSLSDGRADISMLKRVFESLSALSPSGNMAEAWEDTVEFGNIDGQILFREGLASGQKISLQMDNLDIRGEGGIDLLSRRFDYDGNITILGEPAPQTIPVREEYQGIAWPVECSAGFDSPQTEYCDPDLQRAREVFARIDSDEISRRTDEAVSGEADELRERARDLLDDLRD